MRYVTRSRVEGLKYETLCARTARRQQAAKAALVRQGFTARVPIGNWVSPSVTGNIRATGRRRKVLVRAIDRVDAKHPRIALCIAIVIVLVCFYLASDPGESESTTVRMHVASPAT